MSGQINPRPRGFTLVEILVTIGIIVVLIGILIPVVSKARKAAQVASVTSQINDLAGIIQQYQGEHGSLPGPLPWDQVYATNFTGVTIDTAASSKGFETNGWDASKITMTENMILGLAGGLKPIITNPTAPPTIQYDPALVGTGPMNLNPANPKKGRAYLDQKNLSWRPVGNLKTGKYEDNAGAADDSLIPEILDTFPSPMPILYLRARKGQQPPAGVLPASWTNTNNFVITYDPGKPANDPRVGQYDLSQVAAYTQPVAGRYIGEGKDIAVSEYVNAPGAQSPGPGSLPHGLFPFDVNRYKIDKGDNTTYQYPYNSYAYFRDPTSTDNQPQPRAKDGFILISAGLDRVYGTSDDITSFGQVNP